MKEKEKFLNLMGFKTLAIRQYFHPQKGIIHLKENFTYKDIADSIFNLGQDFKCDKIKAVLNIKS